MTSKGIGDRQGGDAFKAAIAVALVVLVAVCARTEAFGQDCPGDCDGDLVVSVGEVVTCIGRALGGESDDCAACDPNEDGQVTIDEIVEVVGATLQALVVSAEGVCMRPGVGGLVPCAQGTEVTLSRCVERSRCLDDEDSRTPFDVAMTGADGRFSLMTCRGAASVLLFEAAVEATSQSKYRTMDFGPLSAGFALSVDQGRVASLALLDGLEISPRSEAAVRLLSESGLQNFTDEGVIEIIESVALATANTSFAGLDAAAAAEVAAMDALQDEVVQETLGQNRLDVVVTQEGTVQASSVFNGDQFPAPLSIDGSRRTSWFSDGAVGGNSETFRWMGAQDDLISSVSILSNREHPQFTGFGFESLRVDILDARGLVVFTRSFSLPGETDRDVTVSPDVVGRSVLLTFIGHDDPSCGGFSELIVFARR